MFWFFDSEKKVDNGAVLGAFLGMLMHIGAFLGMLMHWHQTPLSTPLKVNPIERDSPGSPWSFLGLSFF